MKSKTTGPWTSPVPMPFGVQSALGYAIWLCEQEGIGWKNGKTALFWHLVATLAGHVQETPSGLFDAKDLRLIWGEHKRDGGKHIEWSAPCGCAFHPDGEQGPHVHPCEEHAKRGEA